ncbi:hypothetical protein BKA93DRAFT_510864 [Sparassis latifolia]
MEWKGGRWGWGASRWRELWRALPGKRACGSSTQHPAPGPRERACAHGAGQNGVRNAVTEPRAQNRTVTSHHAADHNTVPQNRRTELEQRSPAKIAGAHARGGGESAHRVLRRRKRSRVRVRRPASERAARGAEFGLQPGVGWSLETGGAPQPRESCVLDMRGGLGPSRRRSVGCTYAVEGKKRTERQTEENARGDTAWPSISIIGACSCAGRWARSPHHYRSNRRGLRGATRSAGRFRWGGRSEWVPTRGSLATAFTAEGEERAGTTPSNDRSPRLPSAFELERQNEKRGRRYGRGGVMSTEQPEGGRVQFGLAGTSRIGTRGKDRGLRSLYMVHGDPGWKSFSER